MPIRGGAIEERFELLERVGRGSWGEVFRARDRESDALVAIKKLHAHFDDPIAVERFSREARLLARISGEHVVRYVADGVDEHGTPCLVVEWLEGEDLASRQRVDPLTGPTLLDVARQMAIGLEAIHAEGIVHRDVKPSNAFLVPRLDRTPRVVLIDLGVARARAETTLTNDGIAIGTPYYMSPEQARGDVEIGAASDLFSLGVVLFELASGQRPFRGDDLFAVLAKIVLAETPRLEDVAPFVPPEMAALVARALAKDPRERFGSAREMAAAIAAVPPFTSARGTSPDDGATAVLTQGLASTLEQRIVTGVFAKLPPWSDEGETKATFGRVAEAAGGVAYPLLGSNLVAVFGGQRSRGDEVSRAARAALALTKALDGARVAIATGRAVAGQGGLSGDVIERGAREIERARPGDVHLDAATARLVGDAFEVIEEDGRLVLRVPPVSLAPAKMAPARTLLGKATPCVGRDRELGSLEALFREVESESLARAALVTGVAGAGKSRLRHELLGRIGEAPSLILFGRGDSLAAGSPFAMLSGAIRRAADVREGDPEAVQREAIAALVRRHAGPADVEEIALGVAEIAGVGAARPADAMHAADRIRAAWEAWIEAASRHGAVLIICEDLHAGDVPSVRLVDAALGRLAGRPLFVVAFARPEVDLRFVDLWSTRDLQRIALPRLSTRASERLVRAALGEAFDASIVERIATRADGNAFFLEELIRAVAEHGEVDALPVTVLGMVQARLDALGPNAKRLLRAASVFGDVFWRRGVHAVLGGPRAIGTGPDELDDLARREVITRRGSARFTGEEEFVFRHALVAEASYAGLTDADRRIAHRLAADWLEARGERDALALAEHHARAGDAEGARRHFLTAAEQALRGSDFEATLACAARVHEGGDRADDLAGAAHLVRAEAHRWRGELALAAEHAVDAAELLTPASAPWFHAIREAVAAHGRLGHIDEVAAWAEESARAVAEKGAVGPQIASLAPAAVHLLYAGREADAERLIARVEALFAGAQDVDLVIVARVHQMRAIGAAHRKDAETELAEQRAALATFERAGDMRNATLTRANMGYAIAQLGLFEAAEEALEKARAAADRLGLRTVGPLAMHNLGLVFAHLGRLEAAREVEAAAVESFATQGDPRLEGAARVYLARILQASGDFDGAEREARAAFAATSTPGGSRVGALASLARALLSKGDLPAALEAAREAEPLLALPAIEEWEGEARVTVAEVLDAAGDREHAKAALRGALDALATRAARLRDPATISSLLERIPEHVRALELAKAWNVPLPEALRR